MKESKVCIYRSNQNLRGYSLIYGTRVANGYMYNKAVMFGQLSCSRGNLHATSEDKVHYLNMMAFTIFTTLPQQRPKTLGNRSEAPETII